MKRPVLLLALVLAVASCGTQKRIRALRSEPVGTLLTLPQEETPQELSLDTPRRDTLVVHDDEGRELLIMRATRDEDGEMVATDVIDAAYVTARFRNVAERHGKVDLRFQVIVPARMQDSRWQLRLRPEMILAGERTPLDSIIISGSAYRKAQLRGYEQYERFLRSIMRDSSLFLRERELEIFLERNLPQLYRLKGDTSRVSDAEFASLYGVTEQDAVLHYTNRARVRANLRKLESRERMFARYVKAPLVTEGLRLDTVITSPDGDFIYEYLQTVNTQPQMKSVEISLQGDIWSQEARLYRIPEGEPLTFYISSLSAFADERLRYMTRIVERQVRSDAVCRIDFKVASAEVDAGFGGNGGEIARIKRHLAALLDNEEFDMDSITVTASCSPEGEYGYNTRLSRGRSESVSRYFQRYIASYRDSLRLYGGMALGLGTEDRGAAAPLQDIHFISRSEPENWTMFRSLVAQDPALSEADREDIAHWMREENPDRREAGLRSRAYYPHLLAEVYPRLRTVRFDFFLHRKGMVKDTVHTTVLDTAYMRGVRSILDRDYRTAAAILRPYGDFNAAVALCALDYNASAMDILQRLERSDKVEYMFAILYSRLGKDAEAVEHYLNSCRLNPAFVHRGNLDPEISALIKAYGLNKE